MFGAAVSQLLAERPLLDWLFPDDAADDERPTISPPVAGGPVGDEGPGDAK